MFEHKYVRLQGVSILKKIKDGVLNVAFKMGGEVHLRSIRDANGLTMSLAILAGFMTLINSMVLDPKGFLSGIFSPTGLATAQQVGTRIVNATLGVWAIAICFAVAYCLAKNKGFVEPMIPAILSFVCLITLTPLTNTVTSLSGTKTMEVSGVLTSAYTGISGMFCGIIIALLATEILLRLDKIDAIKIKMPDMVPTMVSESFSSMIAFFLVVIPFGLLGFALDRLFGTSLNGLIVTLIQTPLKGIATSLPGFLLMMLIFNLLFAIGIHPSGIIGSILDPIMLVAITENMNAVAAGKPAPNIITGSFENMIGLVGGTGCTLALIIAVLLFSKRPDHLAIAKLALVPGLFNINEPVIFGFPIVMNPIMAIPFIFVTQINYVITYGLTAIGLVGKFTVMVPWTTPPIISGFIGTGGDWRMPILQVLLMVIDVMMYLPFLRASERHDLQVAEAKEATATVTD